MPIKIMIFLFLISLGLLPSQDEETFILNYTASKTRTIVYKRIIRFDQNRRLFQVRDYFENGQIQMDASYSSFDKRVKEAPQCNHRSNTKEGPYQEWHANGQTAFTGNYQNGLRTGSFTSWYENGQKEAEENWRHGQLHGRARYWSERGELQFKLTFAHGENENPRNVRYPYLCWLPKDYHNDPAQKWPLIIYLHGGSDRGTDLKKLYSTGIPDQIYRGREFPFIVAAPQCPMHLRWSTDHWFESFFKEITAKYRVDTDRVYLTGLSLGGSGTWYLATKYPEKFAAIAPMSGFTSHMDSIDRHIDRLSDMPIWAFHGKLDDVVPIEETERMIQKLQGRNGEMKFTSEPEVGHWIHWLVYPNQELYDWFLLYKKKAGT